MTKSDIDRVETAGNIVAEGHADAMLQTMVRLPLERPEPIWRR